MADTDIKVKITAKDETKAGVSSIENGMANMAKKISLAAAGAAAFSFAMNNVKKSLDFADRLDKLNRQYGVSISFLQDLNALARDSGADLGALSLGIKDLTINIGKLNSGDKKLNAVFTNLGIRTDGRKVEDIFIDVIDAVGKIDNEFDRMTIAQELFGRGAKEAMAVAVQGADGAKVAFDKLSETTSKLSDEEVATLDAVGDGIARIGNEAVVAAGKVVAFWAAVFKDGGIGRRSKQGFDFSTAPMDDADRPKEDPAKAASAARAAAAAKAITAGGAKSTAEVLIFGTTKAQRDAAADDYNKEMEEDAQARFDNLQQIIEEEGKRQLELVEYKQALADTEKQIADQRVQTELDANKKITDDAVRSAAIKSRVSQDFTDMSIGLLGQALNANKRTATEQRNIAYTMAIADGASSAIKAWNAGMSTGGAWAPAVAAGYLALSLATTGVQIATISNTSFASGSRNARGGYARVGEYGPEDMYVPPGAAIRNASQTAQTGGGGDAAQNVVINFHTQQNVVETMRLKVRSGEARGFIQDLRSAMK